MDQGARLWMMRTAQKNLWRVSQWYELEDLIQEGYLAYAETVRRYGYVEAPQHLMALFKRVYMSRLHDMATRRTRNAMEVVASALGSDDTIWDAALNRAGLPGVDEILGIELGLVPAHVREALALFYSPEGLRRLRHKSRWRGRGRRRRETLNERFCRLTGYDPKQVDIVRDLRACLTGG